MSSIIKSFSLFQNKRFFHSNLNKKATSGIWFRFQKGLFFNPSLASLRSIHMNPGSIIPSIPLPKSLMITSLPMAMKEGSQSLVASLLEKGANPNEEMLSNGFGPLMSAARDGNAEMVSLLLKYGADVNKATNDSGLTPLLIASSAGHIQIVHLLVSRGANVNVATKDNGATPLFEAAREGHAEVVKYLIKQGADVNQCTTDDHTSPLTIACELDHRDVVRELLLAKPNVNIVRSTDGLTPLLMACLMGNLQIVDMLLQNGADPNLRTMSHETNREITPLLQTILHGRKNVPQLVKLLVQYRANVEEAVLLGTSFGKEGEVLVDLIVSMLKKN